MCMHACMCVCMMCTHQGLLLPAIKTVAPDDCVCVSVCVCVCVCVYVCVLWKEMRSLLAGCLLVYSMCLLVRYGAENIYR